MASSTAHDARPILTICIACFHARRVWSGFKLKRDDADEANDDTVGRVVRSNAKEEAASRK